MFSGQNVPQRDIPSPSPSPSPANEVSAASPCVTVVRSHHRDFIPSNTRLLLTGPNISQLWGGHLRDSFAPTLTMKEHMKTYVERRTPWSQEQDGGQTIPLPCRPRALSLFIRRVPVVCWGRTKQEGTVPAINGHHSLLTNNEWIIQHLASS